MNDANLTKKGTNARRSHQLLIRWLCRFMIATMIAPIFFWLAMIVQKITSH
jgi:hypothetical protein